MQKLEGEIWSLPIHKLYKLSCWRSMTRIYFSVPIFFQIAIGERPGAPFFLLQRSLSYRLPHSAFIYVNLFVAFFWLLILDIFLVTKMNSPRFSEMRCMLSFNSDNKNLITLSFSYDYLIHVLLMVKISLVCYVQRVSTSFKHYVSHKIYISQCVLLFECISLYVRNLLFFNWFC
jgi:hypothetical protein